MCLRGGPAFGGFGGGATRSDSLCNRLTLAAGSGAESGLSPREGQPHASPRRPQVLDWSDPLYSAFMEHGRSRSNSILSFPICTTLKGLNVFTCEGCLGVGGAAHILHVSDYYCNFGGLMNRGGQKLESVLCPASLPASPLSEFSPVR